MKNDPQAAVRDHIFISYRRDDAKGASGRLYDWLRIAFGREQVFRDVHSIGVGKWRDKVDDALARSAVCVAVIGPRWANTDNLPRLRDEDDMVRHELVNALAGKGVTLVPTLVEGAKVPKTADLPPELKPLFQWNALPLTEEGWEDDTRRLIAEIEKAAQLTAKPDLDTLLREAGAAQVRIAELEQARHLQADQIEELRQTVDELGRKLAEAKADERPKLAEAFAALARGDSRAAEDAFEREFEVQSRAADEAHKRKAEAARNVGNLALLHDVTKAVSFYRKALAVDSDDADTARLLGRALMLSGDLKGAEGAFSKSFNAAITKGDSRDEMIAKAGLGDVFKEMGRLDAAYEAYSAALHVSLRRLGADPTNTECQHDVSVTHDRIGEVLMARGDRAGALTAYRNALPINEALAELNPANSSWQHGLSVDHDRIGEVLMAQGDGAGALTAYRKALAIRQDLAVRKPANTTWQRDLFVSYNKIGGMLLARGDGAGALTASRKALAIAKALAESDRANTTWQRDLSVSLNGIGDVLAVQGDGAGALTAHREALAIAEDLAARDPTNTTWQRGLFVSHSKIGEALMARGDESGALTAYRKDLAISEALAKSEPANTEWQTDLAFSLGKVGDVLMAQGEKAEAEAAYRKSLAIAEALAALDRDNTTWQRDLSVSHKKVGDVLMAQGEKAGAEAAYRKSLAIAEDLAAVDRANTIWQDDVSVSCEKIGNVLMAQGEKAGAEAAYRKGLAITEALVESNPSNVAWQRDLVASFVMVSKGTGDEAWMQRALDIAHGMQQSGKIASGDAWITALAEKRSAQLKESQWTKRDLSSGGRDPLGR
jgi:tetratricopeptide (TPR) repeat protein